MNKNAATQEQREAMVAAYLKGETLLAAAQRFGYKSHKAALNAIRKLGVPSRKQPCSKQQKAEIVRLYHEERMPPKKIAPLVGLHWSTVTKIAKEAGVIRQRFTRSAYVNAYSVKEDFFDNITTPLQAYVLGFIAGDGCVSKNLNILTINLARRDRGHLVKILDALGSNAPIKDGFRSPQEQKHPNSTIQVCSRRLIRGLLRNGITPQKSLTLQPWNGPDHLQRFWFLGLIDADGFWRSEQINSSGTKIWSMGLVGSRPTVEAFARFVEGIAGKYVSPVPKASIFDVKYHGLSLLKKLAQALYDGAPIWLDRKKAIVDEMLSYQPRQRSWAHLDKEAVEELLRLHPTKDAAAQSLDMLPSQFAAVCKRLEIKRTYGDWSKITAEMMLEARNRLGTWNAAAREMGIPFTSFNALRRRFEI